MLFISIIPVYLHNKQIEIMKTYKAIVTEEKAANKGQVLANTKSPGKYKGMTKEEFTKETKYISAFKISIIEIQ